MVLASACTSIQKVTRNEMSLAGESKQDQGGFIMDAKAFDQAAILKNSSLSKKVAVQVRGNERQVPMMLLTPPVFRIKVTNNTGHVAKLKGITVKLVDGASNTYDPFTKDQLDDNLSDMAEAEAANGVIFPDSSLRKVRGSVKRLKFLDQNAEILPDFTETFYVSFNLGLEEQTTDALNRWLAEQSTLKLMIYGLPVEADQAGNITKRVNFDYPLAVTTYEDTYKVGMGGAQKLSSRKIEK